jgi:hypothetical protein
MYIFLEKSFQKIIRGALLEIINKKLKESKPVNVNYQIQKLQRLNVIGFNQIFGEGN